ncbi:ERF family protein [Ligilactobacillus acidipiscis]|uniref:ERF family protein n=1 Tax=Ligilactobacillus acidipiscis TaxID=89059 RepID=UPI0023F951B1|nr:ERF family protein [Ligilactobacillus acidipiscis]WEV56155.1 ERF family protein [Ligilactobacillus acidipiscis]
MSNSLLNIQDNLVAPKGQWNKFGGYSYRSAEDILKAVKPLLVKNEATLTLTDEPILVGDWHYIKATATLKTKDGEQVVTGYARESESKKGMDNSQITGTASSYARKYALNGLLLIDDTKDADSNGYHQQNSRSVAKKQDTRPNYSQASNQEQNTLENKRRLFHGFAKQIADLIKAQPKQVENQLIKQAQENSEYQKAVEAEDKNKTATILLRFAETMKNEAQKKNAK